MNSQEIGNLNNNREVLEKSYNDTDDKIVKEVLSYLLDNFDKLMLVTYQIMENKSDYPDDSPIQGGIYHQINIMLNSHSELHVCFNKIKTAFDTEVDLYSIVLRCIDRSKERNGVEKLYKVDFDDINELKGYIRCMINTCGDNEPVNFYKCHSNTIVTKFESMLQEYKIPYSRILYDHSDLYQIQLEDGSVNINKNGIEYISIIERNNNIFDNINIKVRYEDYDEIVYKQKD